MEINNLVSSVGSGFGRSRKEGRKEEKKRGREGRKRPSSPMGDGSEAFCFEVEEDFGAEFSDMLARERRAKSVGEASCGLEEKEEQREKNKGRRD